MCLMGDRVTAAVVGIMGPHGHLLVLSVHDSWEHAEAIAEVGDHVALPLHPEGPEPSHGSLLPVRSVGAAKYCLRSLMRLR